MWPAGPSLSPYPVPELGEVRGPRHQSGPWSSASGCGVPECTSPCRLPAFNSLTCGQRPVCPSLSTPLPDWAPPGSFRCRSRPTVSPTRRYRLHRDIVCLNLDTGIVIVLSSGLLRQPLGMYSQGRRGTVCSAASIRTSQRVIGMLLDPTPPTPSIFHPFPSGPRDLMEWMVQSFRTQVGRFLTSGSHYALFSGPAWLVACADGGRRTASSGLITRP